MKHFITVHQGKVIELGLDVDVCDLFIYDFLKDHFASPSCSKVFVDNTEWYIPNIADIIEGLPIMGITSPTAIKRRISKLNKAELIKLHPANRKWMRLGRNAHKLESSEEW